MSVVVNRSKVESSSFILVKIEGRRCSMGGEEEEEANCKDRQVETRVDLSQLDHEVIAQPPNLTLFLKRPSTPLQDLRSL